MGKLSFENGKFRFKTIFMSAERGGVAIENKLAKDAGFQWDADSLRWVTRNAHKALKLRRFADSNAERKLKSIFITKFAPPEQIIYPDHLSPRLHQIESAWHCLTRSPAYCADEAGLGKTITSILCVNTVPGKTLIICPPHLVHNWLAEIKRWSVTTPDVVILEGGKSIANDRLWDADFVILPDSLIANPLTLHMVITRKWEWLFVDEAHRYKEATTQRVQALTGVNENGRKESSQSISGAATRVVLLSGTPIPNGRPIELYPLLAHLSPSSIGHRSFTQYGEEFCGAKRVVRYEGQKAIVSWDFRGHSNLGKLRAELKSQLMVRHLKKNCLKELPPKERKIIFLDSSNHLMPLEKAALKNRSLDELLGEDHTQGDLATYRREVGEAKIEGALTLIEEWLEDNEGKKLVVFAHHIGVVETLTRELQAFSPIMIRGGLSKKEKAKRVQLFQTKEKHRVAIGNMEAMGTGNTMTAAEDVFVIEPSWVPGVNEQAEDRVHRMTQLGQVYIRYLVLRDSLDERLLYRCLEKQEAIEQAMD